MKTFLERSLRAGPIVMAAVALLLVFLTNHAVQVLIEDNHWVVRTITTRGDAEKIRQYLLEESGARYAWRMTGEEEQRVLMEQSGQAATRNLASVRALTSDNPAQQERLRQLEPLVQQRLELSARRTVQQPLTNTVTPGSRELQLEGIRINKAIRTLVNAFVAEEDALLAERTADRARSARLTVGIVAIVSILSILGILLAAGALRRELRVRETAAASLRNGEQRFRSLLAAAPDALVITNETGRIVLVNAQAEKLFGWMRGELRDKPVEILVPEHLQTQITAIAENPPAPASTQRIGAHWEMNARRKDGSGFPAEISLSPLRTDEGLLITAVIRDLTERQQAERSLQDSEARFHTVWETAHDAMRLLDENGIFISVNESFCRLVGLRREELEGHPFTVVYSDERDPAELQSRYQERFRDRRIVSQEQRRMVFHGGRVVELEMTSTFIELPGRPVLLLGVLRDITERNRAEQALRESERRFRQLVHTLPAAVYACDTTGHITLYNEAAVALWGREPDLVNDVWCGSWKIFNRDGSPLPLDECPMAITMRTGQAVRGREIVIERPDGTRSHVLPHPVATRDTTGALTGGVNMLVDLTERLQADERLARERRLLRTVIDNLPGYIFAKDTGGRYTVSNQAHVRLMGAGSEAELLGKTVFDFFPAAIAQHFADDDQALVQSGQPVLNREEFSESNGQRTWYHLNKIPLRDETGGVVGLVGIKQDITVQKMAEESVRQAEAKYRRIFDNAVEGIVQTDPSGRIITANPTLARLLGYDTPEELLAASLNMNRDVHANPGDRTSLLRRARAGGRDFTQCQFKRRDGKLIWVSFNVRVVRDERGEPQLFEGTCLDITESRGMEEQLRQSQKMEAIGQLAGGIAHDFNNIIGAILGNVDLIRLLPEQHPGREESLDAIHTASRRAADLVKQILAFSRRQEVKRQPMELRTIIGEVLKLLRATIPASVQFKADLATTPTVLADPSEIHQVAMNLCTNAWHSLKDGPGIIRVALTETVVDEALARVHPDLRPGPYVRLTIADTGCGMDAATLARIFDPFFTTKPAGQGTGLGLAVVHGILKNHDGGIVVESQPGKGTTFQLYFPVFATSIPETAAESKALPQGNGEHILFVDDEKPLADIGAAALKRLGYRVTKTTNPAEALAWFRTQPDQFALVITDWNMPGLDGGALAEQLRATRPDIRLILATGYSVIMDAEAAQKRGFSEILLKPYALQSLGEAVQRVLKLATPTEP